MKTHQQAPRLVLFGPPGAGKGTIAARLLTKLEPDAYLSTGDHFRRLIANGDARAPEFRHYMESGELIPDAIVINEFKQLWESGRFNAGFVLDGFPRTKPQLEALEALLAADGDAHISKVILIEAPDELVLQRLGGRRVCYGCDAIYNVNTLPPKIPGVCDNCGGPLSQRPDDNEATIRQRLTVYKRQTAEILSDFSQMGLLFVIDSHVGSEEVVRLIEAELGW